MLGIGTLGDCRSSLTEEGTAYILLGLLSAVERRRRISTVVVKLAHHRINSTPGKLLYRRDIESNI